MADPRRTCALLALVAVAACDPNAEQAGTSAAARDVAEVRVVPDTLELRAGGRAQLVAQVDDADGQPIGGADIIFSSDDASLLVVSPTGLVSSIGRVGRGTIRVSSGPRSVRAEVTIGPGPAAAILPVEGDARTGTVAVALPSPLVVRVQDRFKNPCPKTPVSFAAGGGGRADPAVSETDEQGLARVTWTLGPRAGAQVLEARVEGLETTAKLTARVAAGPPSVIQKHGPELDAAPVGTVLAPAVLVTDVHQNPVGGAIVAFKIKNGGGSLSAPTGTTDATGIARVSWTLGSLPIRNEIAADLLAAGAARTQVTWSVDATAGPPARITIQSGDRQAAAVGSRIPRPITVRVTDAAGHPVAGADVTFSPARRPAALVRTDARGAAAFSDWTLEEAGQNTLTVSVPGVPEAVRLTATAGAKPRR